jgi:hypothetical protein
MAIGLWKKPAADVDQLITQLMTQVIVPRIVLARPGPRQASVTAHASLSP